MRFYDEEYETLEMAITAQPTAAVNYMLRGELCLKRGYPDMALVDFELAVELAGEQAEKSEWGYVNYTLLERAEAGLEKAKRAIRKGLQIEGLI